MPRYGQHFLINKHAIEQIVAAVGLSADDVVLEIGPGKGVLTALLVASGATVVAVEIDTPLTDHLKRKFSFAPHFHLVHDDILKFDFDHPILKNHPRPIKVVGNLPYNISSPILRRLCEWDHWQYAWVMVQKEMGDRLAAKPGTSDYGALTVGMNLQCEMQSIISLGSKSFDPPPKVDSSVIKITRRDVPLTTRIKETQRVVQAAFQQRRKTILNSLSHGLGLTKEQVNSTLTTLGVDPGARPETLAPEIFIRLADSFPL